MRFESDGVADSSAIFNFTYCGGPETGPRGSLSGRRPMDMGVGDDPGGGPGPVGQPFRCARSNQLPPINLCQRGRTEAALWAGRALGAPAAPGSGTRPSPTRGCRRLSQTAGSRSVGMNRVCGPFHGIELPGLTDRFRRFCRGLNLGRGRGRAQSRFGGEVTHRHRY